MVEDEYVSIQEAAHRCGVSSKTIQRAIQANKLVARYPKPNRCEIALSDLEAFRPGHLSGQPTESVETRISALEERLEHLEQQVADLLSRLAIPSKPHHRKSAERTTGPLPKYLVSLQAFARHHCVAETKVQTHVDLDLLPAKRGEWVGTDGAVVTLALDAKGRSAFYQIYHGVPPFVECQHCPH